MCHHLWTLLCEHASAKCFLKHIWPFMSIYNLCLCTYTSTLPLANHHTMCEHCHLHITMCTKQVYLHLHLLHCHLHIIMCLWTLLCEHASAKCFLKHIWPFMSIYNFMFMYIYMYYTTTCKSPCVNNVWTLLCEHPSVNCFIKGILPACPCTKQVYLHLHLLHCHLHIY